MTRTCCAPAIALSLILGVLAPPTIAAAASAAPVNAQSISSIDDRIRREMTEGGLVGVAAAIIVDGKVVWRGGYGLADRESGRAFTTDTVMNVASISKTFVGAAMMLAQEEGKLSIDADINTYLSFPVKNPNHPAQPITLRQIATHTSSITDRWPIYAARYHFGRNSPEPLAQFLQGYLAPGGADYSPASYLPAAPGTERDYSNIGAGLAGYIVERTTRQSLDTYTERRIFKPLGMKARIGAFARTAPPRTPRFTLPRTALRSPFNRMASRPGPMVACTRRSRICPGSSLHCLTAARDPVARYFDSRRRMRCCAFSLRPHPSL